MSTKRRALITGISGQDAAYLSELLLGDGYEVFGTYRPTSKRDFWRLDALGIRNHPGLRLLEFEASDVAVCRDIIGSTAVSEIYNLSGQSSAVASVAAPVETAQTNGMNVLYLLEAIRSVCPSARLFQAGSAELFGQPQVTPQNETTPFHPTNPYGVSKLFAHWAVVNYREGYGVFASNGILFNHESPLRGMEFVTRKITHSMAKIKLGLQECMELGNLEAKRDWGYARDYARGMLGALRAPHADTFVFATGRVSTVRDFVTLAGQAAGFELVWRDTPEGELGVDRESGKILVRVNRDLYRPVEINQRVGNPERANRLLGWRPSITLAALCAMMVKADLARLADRHH
jgi:GDPmannose 4,6-dehydratase